MAAVVKTMTDGDGNVTGQVISDGVVLGALTCHNGDCPYASNSGQRCGDASKAKICPYRLEDE